MKTPKKSRQNLNRSRNLFKLKKSPKDRTYKADTPPVAGGPVQRCRPCKRTVDKGLWLPSVSPDKFQKIQFRKVTTWKATKPITSQMKPKLTRTTGCP